MAIPRVRSAFILGVLAGCAQTPMKVDHALVDAKEERLIVLEERLEKQASQLEKLKAAY